MRNKLFRAFLLSSLGIAGLAEPALAQTATPPTLGAGFQVNRYEPTAAGEWSLWVDHPWYSSTRYFAAGLTLNYGHDPLVFGTVNSSGTFNMTGAAIQHQLIGHVDLAGSFLDRVLVTASLPVTLYEGGTPKDGVTLSSVATGDPRIGALARIWGQPYKDAFSISAGASVWIPIDNLTKSFKPQVGESGWRVMPKVVLGGLTHNIMWSFTGDYYYRPTASIGNIGAVSGDTVGQEVNIGAALAYADSERRLAIGPEFVAGTVLTGGNAFKQNSSSMEVLLGAHYNLMRVLQISVGGGVGLLREPGTPDGRALLRLSYAPMAAPPPVRVDTDGDGVYDGEDLCPTVPQGDHPDPKKPGCPLTDKDGDGVYDDVDQCPDVPKGDHPDPNKLGCPIGDKDGDGVLDDVDQCPDVAQGDHPDKNKPGCPLTDKDGDGVYDDVDQCIDIPAGPHPDANKPGCPDTDTDGDGVFDSVDQCKTEPAGLNPDPDRLGCPLPDRDHDMVPDKFDACPDKPGAPSPDPKKNGCPGMVEMKGGMIVILKEIFFATDKDIIQKKSFPVLDAVADTLKAVPSIKKVGIEGHTDNRGKEEHNIELSDRRAKSVMRWLIEHGVSEDRLEAKGYGPTRPIADNKTNKGRAINRRVDFRIIDPPQVQNEAQPGKDVEGLVEDEKPGKKGKGDKADKKAKAEGDKADKKAKAEGDKGEGDKADKGEKKGKGKKGKGEKKADKKGEGDKDEKKQSE